MPGKFAAKRDANEVKIFYHATAKDDERQQQILTSAQQLKLRNSVKNSLAIDDAVAVIDLYIFGDTTSGDADEIIGNTAAETHINLTML